MRPGDDCKINVSCLNIVDQIITKCDSNAKIQKIVDENCQCGDCNTGGGGGNNTVEGEGKITFHLQINFL